MPQIQAQTITLPAWLKEITPQPKNYFKKLLKSSVLVKMQEYKKKMAVYENKYSLEFDDFEKQVQAHKKEDFDIWDDYIIWQGLDTAYQKWQKRYFSL